MGFVPKTIFRNVNVSPCSPVGDFFELIIKILGILLVLYVLLGWAVDFVARRLPVKTEVALGRLFSSDGAEGGSCTEKYLQGLLDRLCAQSSLPRELAFSVVVAESKEVNAAAFPGGRIVVFRGLLNTVSSENELAMVLAHELGHYVHRDHLRGMGRALVFLAIAAVLTGTDSSVTRLVSQSLTGAEMRFSQSQERFADRYGLDLLNKTYGHVSGATDFFEKMSRKNKRGRFLYLWATHPYPPDRIEALNRAIAEKGYQHAALSSLEGLRACSVVVADTAKLPGGQADDR